MRTPSSTGWNASDAAEYAKLIDLGKPDLIEIKGMTYCGATSGASNLTMKNVPYHDDVKKFERRAMPPTAMTALMKRRLPEWIDAIRDYAVKRHAHARRAAREGERARKQQRRSQGQQRSENDKKNCNCWRTGMTGMEMHLSKKLLSHQL